MKWGSRQRHDGFDPWALTPLPRINRLTSTPARAKLRLKMLYGLPRCQTTGPCGWGCRRSSCRCRAAYPLFLYAVDRRDVSEARQRGTRGPSSPTRGVSVVGPETGWDSPVGQWPPVPIGNLPPHRLSLSPCVARGPHKPQSGGLSHYPVADSPTHANVRAPGRVSQRLPRQHGG